jgi:hypothetical protein
MFDIEGSMEKKIVPAVQTRACKRMQPSGRISTEWAPGKRDTRKKTQHDT